MTQICRKCNYIRKESDTSPAWQCPSCQVAYAKVGDSPLINTAHRPASQTTQRVRRTIPASTWKLLILFAVLAAIAWQIGPAHRKQSTHKVFANTAQESQRELKRESQQPVVILYGTSWCGYCAAARRFFETNGIRYTEYDTEKTTEGYEGHKKLGGGGVPLIVIGGDIMHGYNEAGLRQALSPWMQNN